MNIAVIIPALNEAECLPGLIAAILHPPDDRVEIVVVDNGSTDATAAVAQAAGAHAIIEPRRGYGFACLAGVQAAQTLAPEVVVFLDGDYSFDPMEMSRLVEPIRQQVADLVLGSRLLTSGQTAMLPHQRFGNWLTARLMGALYGLPLTDLGPYRAVSADLLARINMNEMTYGWPTEMIVKAAKSRARIAEVPVSYRPRLAGKSKVSGTLRGSVLAGYFILAVTFKYALSDAY